MFQTSFDYNNWGYGSAIQLLITALCLTVTLLVFRSLRRDLNERAGSPMTIAQDQLANRGGQATWDSSARPEKPAVVRERIEHGN